MSINFNYNINNIDKDIVTKYNGKTLVLKNVYIYDGPVTLQYLPSGGIQLIYNDELVIRINDGFIACKEVIYDNKNYLINDFYKIHNNLINTILPN